MKQLLGASSELHAVVMSTELDVHLCDTPSDIIREEMPDLIELAEEDLEEKGKGVEQDSACCLRMCRRVTCIEVSIISIDV